MVQKLLKNRLPLFIAGPCSIESEQVAMVTAEKVAELSERYSGKASFVYKSSFLKDNRTSPGTWTGPGMEEGLCVLRKVSETFGLPVITDIHQADQAAPAAQVCDALQIPAFLCRQTSLLEAAGATGLPLNIKKGQFMAPSNMEGAVKKARLAGSEEVLLTERGTFFGYGDLVVDMRSLSIMDDFCDGVIMDLTHSLQKPGAAGTSSGGDRTFAMNMAGAAAAWGISGMFIETHPDPSSALSDSAVMLDFKSFEEAVERAMAHWRGSHG